MWGVRLVRRRDRVGPERLLEPPGRVAVRASAWARALLGLGRPAQQAVDVGGWSPQLRLAGGGPAVCVVRARFALRSPPPERRQVLPEELRQHRRAIVTRLARLH